jgi:hypothetical protein
MRKILSVLILALTVVWAIPEAAALPGCDSGVDYPGCGGCTCETCVCEMDSYCCDNMWDGICVDECLTQCGGCEKPENCGEGNCVAEEGENCGSCPEDCACTLDESCYQLQCCGTTCDMESGCQDDGCGGLCPCDDEAAICFDGGCCVPVCEGMSCGSDGCGGTCGECEESEYCSEEFACEPIPPCEVKQPLHCDDVLELDTAEGNNVFGSYSCVGWDENGPELGFSFDTDVDDLVVVTVEETGDADHDLFLLEDTCIPVQCIDYDGSEVQFKAQPGNHYFLVVDGYGDDVGTLTLSVWCQSTCVPECEEENPCADDGCMGQCPCADPEAVCFGGECCIPDCEGMICGDDGCGGSCGGCEGTCLDNLVCMDGPGCVSIGEPGCEGCGCEACVCEMDPYCCETAWDSICVSECVDGCGGCLTLDNCGDNACVLEDKETCATCPEDCACGQDESCYQNACCATECNAENGCQPDGCGGVCPCDSEEAVCFDGACCMVSCEAGMGCQDDGCGGMCPCELEEEVCLGGLGGECCIPSCEGKVCGDDGCGGNCGFCNVGACVEGLCLDAPGCVTSGGPGCGGCPCEACVCGMDPYCCENNWDSICVDECVNDCGGCADLSKCGNGSCESDIGENCNTCPEDCACPSGEVCGTLNEGTACLPDMCALEVTALGCCQDEVLYSCTEGETFALDCGTLEDNICGWYVGDDTFTPGYYCGPADLITPGGDPSGEYPLECITCDPLCDGLDCGDDGCGGSCGNCAEEEECVDGLCIGPCDPDCTDKVCGDDGCNGTCGDCADGEDCVDGACTVVNLCGNGVIDDGEECEADADCGGTAVCEECVCIIGCTPDCTDKECGDDGCEGTCGECAAGTTCEDSLCLPGATDDVVSGDAVVGLDGAAGQDLQGTDVAGEEPEKKSSSCSTTGTSNSAALLLLLVTLLAMFAVRRQES